MTALLVSRVTFALLHDASPCLQDAVVRALQLGAHTAYAVVSTGKTVKVHTWKASAPGEVEVARFNAKQSRAPGVLAALARVALQAGACSFGGILYEGKAEVQVLVGTNRYVFTHTKGGPVPDGGALKYNVLRALAPLI